MHVIYITQCILELYFEVRKIKPKLLNTVLLNAGCLEKGVIFIEWKSHCYCFIDFEPMYRAPM